MITIDSIKSYLIQIGKPKVLFIWIPKNAGTSIYEELHNSFGMDRYLTITDAKRSFSNKGLVTFGHMGVNSLLDKGIMSQRFYHNAFVFAVSRNPYDRFVSLLHYLKKHDRIPEDYAGIDLMKQIINGIPPVGLYNFQGLSQCNRQVDWVDNIKVNKILKFENIHSEINVLTEILGKKVSLSHKNKSPNRKIYISELDSKTIELIKEYYEPDFLRFNYSMNIDE